MEGMSHYVSNMLLTGSRNLSQFISRSLVSGAVDYVRGYDSSSALNLSFADLRSASVVRRSIRTSETTFMLSFLNAGSGSPSLFLK
jgi:hypothetical protein